MNGKVKRGLRFYCAIVAALTLVMGMSMTAFAAGGDPITVVNNLSDFGKSRNNGTVKAEATLNLAVHRQLAGFLSGFLHRIKNLHSGFLHLILFVSPSQKKSLP